MSADHTHSIRLRTSGTARGGGKGEDHKDDGGHIANIGSKAAT